MEKNFKYLFFIILILFLINGCSSKSNPISFNTGTQQSGSLQYTLTTSKSSYSLNDTLKAAVTVHNTGTETDTIVVGSSLFTWSLQSNNGQTIMTRGGYNWVVMLQPVEPGQTLKIYSINQVIRNESGKSFTAGKYFLDATMHQVSLSISLVII